MHRHEAGASGNAPGIDRRPVLPRRPATSRDRRIRRSFARERPFASMPPLPPNRRRRTGRKRPCSCRFAIESGQPNRPDTPTSSNRLGNRPGAQNWPTALYPAACDEPRGETERQKTGGGYRRPPPSARRRTRRGCQNPRPDEPHCRHATSRPSRNRRQTIPRTEHDRDRPRKASIVPHRTRARRRAPPDRQVGPS